MTGLNGIKPRQGARYETEFMNHGGLITKQSCMEDILKLYAGSCFYALIERMLDLFHFGHQIRHSYQFFSCT